MSDGGWWQDLLRAVIVVAITVPCALHLRRAISTKPTGWLLAALIAIIFMPALVVGWVWQTVAWSPAHWPVGAQVLYLALLTAKALPMATFVALLVGHDDAAQRARHQLQLYTAQLPWRARVTAILRRQRAALAAGGFCFLVAFSEFEIASLFVLESWPVRLFDMVATGVALPTALGAVLVPLLIQIIIVLPVLWLLLRSPRERTAIVAPAQGAWLAPTLVIAAFTLVVVIPFAVMTTTALPAMTAGAGGVGQEIITSLGVAAAVAISAAGLAAGIALLSARWHRLLWCGLAAPGLLGSLCVGLSVLSVMQAPGLSGVRSSFAPALVGLLIVSLPFVAVTAGAALHLVPQAWYQHRLHHGAVGRRTAKILVKPLALVAVVALSVAYLDVASAGLLMPLERPAVTARLYNLMHYGRTDALAWMVMVTMAVPMLAAALGYACWRSTTRWRIAL